MKSNNVTGEGLFYILDLFEHMKVTYWLDGGWGVDMLTGKQRREHRDIDIDLNAQHTQKVIQKLEDVGYRIKVDWMPLRMELKHEEYGYSDIHPINLNNNRSITQADPEDDSYVFQGGWFSEINYKDRRIPCISRETQLLLHSGYNLAETGHFDIRSLKSIT